MDGAPENVLNFILAGPQKILGIIKQREYYV